MNIPVVKIGSMSYEKFKALWKSQESFETSTGTFVTADGILRHGWTAVVACDINHAKRMLVYRQTSSTWEWIR